MGEEKRIVVVLNKAYELNEMVSALGHVCAGLGASSGAESMSLVDYQDANGCRYPNVSDWSLIVLRGGGAQLRTFWGSLETFDRPRSAYTHTMFSGGSKAQQEATLVTPTDAIEIVAVATLGSRDELDHLTKKFSLWR